MTKIKDKLSLGIDLRCILHELNYSKLPIERIYKMLCDYDRKIDIKEEGDPWNVVDLTQCNPGVIHAAKIKAEVRLRKL